MHGDGGTKDWLLPWGNNWALTCSLAISSGRTGRSRDRSRTKLPFPIIGCATIQAMQLVDAKTDEVLSNLPAFRHMDQTMPMVPFQTMMHEQTRASRAES